MLRVLGALKVATADGIQRIGAPYLTVRHADKETPSKQKQARTASHTGALSDMRKHGLSENGGSTETGDSLRNLTLKDLEAASYELRRPVTEMGSTARGAGSSGASHPMAVNETVIAMLRPKPNMAKLANDPAARPGRRRCTGRHRHHRLVLDRGPAARHQHVERARQGRRPGRPDALDAHVGSGTLLLADRGLWGLARWHRRRAQGTHCQQAEGQHPACAGRPASCRSLPGSGWARRQ
ncbi:hypothetical protein [Streptomyces tibetensis]|uniref:hypothetical protein n=1 Tax=Streptomyces tibetensis TaxID=2382123 RepID=UPI0033FDCB57